jgi:hypothetical protein
MEFVKEFLRKQGDRRQRERQKKIINSDERRKTQTKYYTAEIAESPKKV